MSINGTPQLYAYAVHPRDVDRFWPVLQADMERAIEEQLLGWTTAAELRERAREGSVLMVCMNGPDDEHLVSMALEMVPVPDLQHPGEMLQACNVIAIGGSQMAEWLQEMESVLTQVAQEQGCSIIIWKGRPGWQRVMRKFNYEPAYTVMAKRLMQ